MEFVLRSWSGDQNIYINLRGGENSIKYMRMSSTPSPQVINDPSLKWNFSYDFTRVLDPFALCCITDSKTFPLEKENGSFGSK